MRVVPLLLACLVGAGAARAEEPAAPAPIPQLPTASVLEGHAGLVRTLAFSPDGERLASGGPDRTLRLWDLEQAAGIATLRLPRGG